MSGFLPWNFEIFQIFRLDKFGFKKKHATNFELNAFLKF